MCVWLLRGYIQVSYEATWSVFVTHYVADVCIVCGMIIVCVPAGRAVLTYFANGIRLMHAHLCR